MHSGISRASRPSSGGKPSPRFASVVGQRQTRAPAPRGGRAHARRRASRGRSSCAARGSRSPPAARSAVAHARRGTPRSRAAARRRGRGGRAPRARRRRRSPRARRAGMRGRSGARGRRGRRRCELLHLAEVLGDRALTEAVDPAAAVGGEKQDELDPGLPRCLDGGMRLGGPDVVELADGRIAGREHLAVGLHVALADVSRGQTPGQVQHGLAPGPEVAALGLAAQGALERVAVRVDEAGEREPGGHRATLPLPRRWPRESFRPRSRRSRTPSRSCASPPSPCSSSSCSKRTARGATGSRRSSRPRRSPTRSTASSPGAGTSSRSSGSSPTRWPTAS